MRKSLWVIIFGTTAVGCGDVNVFSMSQGPQAKFDSKLKAGLASLDSMDFAAAKTSFAAAVEIAKQSNSSENLAIALQNAAVAELSMGEFANAKTFAEQAVEALDEAKSTDDFLKAAALIQLGKAQERAAEFDAADAAFDRALKLFATLSDVREQTFQTWLFRGQALTSAGKPNDAMAALERALAVEHEHLKIGEESTHMAAAYCEMGRTAMQASNYEKAGNCFDRANKILRAQRMADKEANQAASLLESWVAANVVQLMQTRKQPVKLDSMLVDAAKNFQEHAPQPAAELVFIRRELGSLLMSDGKIERAEVELKSALRDGQKLYASKHPEFRSTIEVYARLLERTNRKDEADRVRKTVLTPEKNASVPAAAK